MTRQRAIDIINAINETMSLIEAIEIQTTDDTLKSVDEFLADENITAKQVNVYFQSRANARAKRIHFTAKKVCYNQIYNVNDDILNATRKSNYSECDASDLQTVCYFLTHAHLKYLERQRALDFYNETTATESAQTVRKTKNA